MNQIHLPTQKKGAVEEIDYMMDFEVYKFVHGSSFS